MKSKLDLYLESFNMSVLEVTKGSYGGKWPMPFFNSVEIGSIIYPLSIINNCLV